MNGITHIQHFIENPHTLFNNLVNNVLLLNYELVAGSLIYMTQEIQTIWQHAIPKSNTENGRISMTFREMV